MGDYYDLWTGLFQSALLGRIPYINVDIAHKAFPASMHVLDIAEGMMRNSRNGGDLRSPMDQHVENSLDKHLKGLRILYKVKGQEASAKSYKYSKLGLPANKLKFKMANGREITVEQYFQNEKKIRLQFPHLPCITVGNAVKSVSLPMEFCSIPPGQVSKPTIF